jgi:hypothetical protein
LLKQRNKAFQNLSVRSSSEPPFELPHQYLMNAAQVFWKPESKNILDVVD